MKKTLFSLMAFVMTVSQLGGVASYVSAEGEGCLTYHQDENGYVKVTDVAGLKSALSCNNTKIELKGTNLEFNDTISLASLKVNGSLTINGGEITVTDENGIYVVEESSLTINDGVINGKGKNAVHVNGGKLTVIGGTVNGEGVHGVRGTNSKINIKGGSLKGSIANKGYGLLLNSRSEGTLEGGRIEGYDVVQVYISKATITNGTIEGTHNGINIFGNSTLRIEGGTIKATNAVVSGNGSAGYEGTSINISGGNIQCGEVEGCVAIYHPQSGDLTISEGIVSGYDSAVEIRAGNLSIEGGKFTSTATSYSCNPNGNGSTTVGAAVAIAQHTTKLPITVEIEGGTFNGVKSVSITNPQTNPETDTKNVSVNITNGTFNGDVEIVKDFKQENVKISGGTFNTNIGDNYIVDNYGLKENSTTEYVVKVKHTVTFNAGEGDFTEGVTSSSREVLDGESILEEQRPADPTRVGYTFKGWLKLNETFDFATLITDDVELTADWIANPTVSYELNGGNFTDGKAGPESVTYDAQLNLERVDLIKNGYSFNDWYADAKFTTKFNFEQYITENVTLYAKWDEIISNDNASLVNLSSAENVEIDEIVMEEDIATTQEELDNSDSKKELVESKDVQTSNTSSTKYTATVQGGVEVYAKASHGSEIYAGINFTTPVAIKIPVKEGVSAVKIKVKHYGADKYNFEGLTLVPVEDGCDNGKVKANQYQGAEIDVADGYATIYTCSASIFVAYTETSETIKSSGSSSGGGGSSRKSTTTNNETTKEDTKIEDTKQDTTVQDSTTAEDSDTVTSPESPKSPTDEEIAKYGEEMIEAYQYAYKNGITTMDNVKDANLEGKLTRIAMAKMLSQYAINILGKTPDETRSATFIDVTEELDAQYDNGITLAYQLGIMGVNLEGQEYRVNDAVTRAEFATALSRLLYSTADGEGAYYSTHLAVLNEKGIISNTTPNLKELRGYVMLMLMRAAK